MFSRLFSIELSRPPPPDPIFSPPTAPPLEMNDLSWAPLPNAPPMYVLSVADPSPLANAPNPPAPSCVDYPSLLPNAKLGPAPPALPICPRILAPKLVPTLAPR